MIDMLDIIVEPNQLAPFLDAKNLLIIDMCLPEHYVKQHIPGAINVQYAEIVVVKGEACGAIPSNERLHKLFSRIGINHNQTIVIYDDGFCDRASRFLWTLHVLGHQNVSIINGGLTSWIAEGYPVCKDIPHPAPSNYTVNHTKDGHADTGYVLEHLFNPKVILVDTRTQEEYEGELIIAEQGGHIPGAINFDWEVAINKNNHYKLLEKDKLMKIIKHHSVTPDKEIIVYCQSHFRSSHTYVALKWLGFPNVKGYEGSWSEWAATDNCPVSLPEQPPITEAMEPQNSQPILPLIITAAQLHEQINNSNLLILDLSIPSIYKNGHIPGAIRLDYPSILYQHDNCDCDIPSNEELSTALSRIGLTPHHHVVAYDRQGGPMASRLLWTLEELGHFRYSYLDGGLSAWQGAGFGVSYDEHHPTPSTYVAVRTGNAIAQKDDIIEKLQHPGCVILDVRMLEEYTNELIISDRGGYIPGAVHYDWQNGIDENNHSCLKSQNDIIPIMENLGVIKDKEIIIYCQTHLRSSHTYILLKSMGYTNLKGYAAGYSEWGNDPDTPITNEIDDDDEEY